MLKQLLLKPLFVITLFSASLSVHAIQAPDFSLKGDNNSTVALSKLKGKVVYVDFWASWCTPCKQSFPWMNEMHNRYKKSGLEVVAINLDAEHADAQRFLNSANVDFTIAYDPAGNIANKYDLQVMPTSFLIDRKGEVIYLHRGFKHSDKKNMEMKISEALKKR